MLKAPYSFYKTYTHMSRIQIARKYKEPTSISCLSYLIPLTRVLVQIQWRTMHTMDIGNFRDKVPVNATGRYREFLVLIYVQHKDNAFTFGYYIIKRKFLQLCICINCLNFVPKCHRQASESTGANIQAQMHRMEVALAKNGNLHWENGYNKTERWFLFSLRLLHAGMDTIKYGSTTWSNTPT